MSKQRLTLDDLKAMRDEQRGALRQRETDGANGVIQIGMGTCGIAAGAKTTFSAIVDRIAAANLDNVVVKQTGCMGLCANEPTVEVVCPGMPGIVYGKVDEAVGRRIVDEHVGKGELLGEYIFDKPAADIINRKS